MPKFLVAADGDQVVNALVAEGGARMLIPTAATPGGGGSAAVRVRTSEQSTPIPGTGESTVALTATHTSETGKRLILGSWTGTVQWDGEPVQGTTTFDVQVANVATPLVGSTTQAWLVSGDYDGTTQAGSFVAVADAAVGVPETVTVAMQCGTPDGTGQFIWSGTLFVQDYTS